LALPYYRKAAELAPEDVEANYQYGVCLFKTGDQLGAESQYRVLLNLDKRKAEQLRKLIGLKPERGNI
jgi:Flp pilus assembly protein TadD